MFNLNLQAISGYIADVFHGREISVGKKRAQWTKVRDLKVGAKIAVQTDDGIDFDEIVGIRAVGREQVYDIEVEGSRNFVGNGIVAHNTYLRGTSATVPVASISASTNFAGLVVDNSIGDLFTASSSGLTRFTIGQTGTLTASAYTTNLGLLYTSATGVVSQNNIASFLTAGTGISLGGTTNVTVTNTDLGSSQSIFKNIAVSGQNTVVTDTNNDTLTLAAGANITITTNDTTDTITIAGSGGASQWTTSSNGIYYGGRVGVGNLTDPTLATLDVRSVSGTLPTASISGATSRAALTVDNSIGDLFTASSSGMTRFVITQNGDVGIGMTNPTNGQLEVRTSTKTYGVYGYNSAGTGLAVGTYGYSASTGGYGVYGYGVNIGVGAYGVGAGSYGLYASGNTWGVYSAGGTNYFSGDVGIGSTSPLAKLDVRGASGTIPVASVSGTTSFAGLLVDNTIGDLFTASSSGLSRFVITQNGYMGLGTSAPTALAQISSSLTGTNYFDIVSGGSSTFTVSDVGITNALPTSFTAAGDVAIAYDISFTNPTASYLKSNAPLYIQSGEQFNSSDLNLSTYNKGNIVVNTEALQLNGAATISGRLNVAMSSTATSSALIENTNTAAEQKILTLKAGATTMDSTTRFINFLNSSGVIAGKIQGNAATTISFTGNGLDMAEYFGYSPQFTRNDFPIGTSVCQGDNGVVPCTASVSAKIVGIISEAPSFIGGIEGDDKVLVGLVGQLPATTDGTQIQSGDKVTVTDMGKVTKATGSAFVVGLALENSNDNKVKMLLTQGFYPDSDLSTQLSELPQIKSQLAQIQSEMDDIKLRLANVETEIATNSANLANWTDLSSSSNIDVATLSAQLATFTDSLKSIGDTQLANTTIGGTLTVGLLHFDDLSAEISSLNGQITINSNLDVLGDATVSGQLKVDKGLVLIDKSTGETYCLQIDNGEITKTKGECP